MKISNAAILRTAGKTLTIEANAILGLIKNLDRAFTSLVESIFYCQGRVVVTGIGKSAIIANKLVATLNSTGTPAMFMHAADAIHGDLGMIRPEDVVLCISKSGETPEIKVLLPLVRNLGTRLIAMVAHQTSSLAQQADLVILTPVDKEEIGRAHV